MDVVYVVYVVYVHLMAVCVLTLQELLMPLKKPLVTSLLHIMDVCVFHVNKHLGWEALRALIHRSMSLR